MKFRHIILVILLLAFSAGSMAQQSDSLILRQISVYSSHDEYCAWPTIVRASNGDLVVAFSLNEEHLGPDGKIVMVRSSDNGKTWTKPQILYDSPIDDRDIGLTVGKNGLMLAHLWSTFWTCEKYRALPPKAYPPETIDRWCKVVNRPDYKAAKSMAGEAGLVSRDNGKTWSPRLPGKDSVKGGIQLPDGTFLVASYRLEKNFVGIYKTDSPEKPWIKIADVKSPCPDSLRFGEPHILRLPSGRIIMMMRATPIPYSDNSERSHLYFTYSDDDGQTWAAPVKTELWGYPPHLLLLSDGRVVCAYGYRRKPYGQRVCISKDGMIWKKENEIVLRNDACNIDLGYPASVELQPGKVLTIYYQPDPKDCPQEMHPPDPNRSRPDILGTIWRVPSK
ncbi:MAG: hypothetical protein GWP06_16930 [Actinobacteria bacterium]|nr:hypothetical protein [Actinomycetota bacterium]